MLVSDLVKHTVWAPGRRCSQGTPELSVFLPTFRRGCDGLLGRVLGTILTQSFSDFELIVVDDASTDGSAAIIADAMARDPRVSCLTHPRNIGLPAVSEYEAYLRSQGRFIVFAFDDFLFEPRAFEVLVAAAKANPNRLVHGYAHLVDFEGNTLTLGRDVFSYDQLLLGNFIANSSFIVERSMLEEVGLYDPHILATRLCDWDLLLRLYRKYRIMGIDVLIGRELGASRRDSLGNTYPLHFGAAHEYFSLDRNAGLRPSSFDAVDVWALPTNPSAGIFEFGLAVRQFFKGKSWASGLAIAMDRELQSVTSPDVRVVGVMGPQDATLGITLEPLARRLADPAANLRFIHIPIEFSPVLTIEMIRLCDVIFVVRQLFAPDLEIIIEAAGEMKIPLCFVVDDNFHLIDEYDGTNYNDDSIRIRLKRFDHVLTPTVLLSDYYRDHDIHDSVMTIDLALDPVLLDRARQSVRRTHENSELRIGVPAGGFRRDGFIKEVLPALQGMTDQPIRLYASFDVNPGASKHIEVTIVPRISAYGDFIDRWSDLDLDIVLHPRGTTPNIPFKNTNILLTSLYLGAVPVVADEPAFAGLGVEQGVLKVSDSAATAQWRDALTRLRDAATRQDSLDSLREFCRKRHDPDRLRDVVGSIADRTGGLSFPALVGRTVMLLKGGSASVSGELLARNRHLEAEMSSRTFRAALLLRRASVGLRSLRPRWRGPS